MFAAGLAWVVSHLANGQAAIAAISSPLMLILASGLLRALSVAGSDVMAAKAARNFTEILRARLALNFLGARLPEPMTPGGAASILVDHSEALRMREIRFTPVRLAAAASPFIILVLTAFASLVAAGILLFTFIFFVFVMILTGTAAGRESSAQLDAMTALSGLLEDRLHKLPIIRHFGAEERIGRQIEQSSSELSRRTVAVLQKAFLSSAALEFFAALSVALVAVYCGFSLLGLLPFPNPEDLTLAEAFFALALAPEFYLPMRRLAAAYHEKQMGEAADEAIEPLLNAEQVKASSVAPFAGLAVRDLTIRLGERVIGPVGLSLGETGLVAIVGSTGSGKTSVLSAIAGQIELASGVIEVPGTGRLPDPMHIAWAAQRPVFLRRSLADNLVLAKPQAERREVEHAALEVGLGPLVQSRGLELDLSVDGAGISGGERRRIGLARALLSDRPLLLCDEPTADLDEASAADIIALLQRLARTRAIVVATHDPKLIAQADNVVML